MNAAIINWTPVSWDINELDKIVTGYSWEVK